MKQGLSRGRGFFRRHALEQAITNLCRISLCKNTAHEEEKSDKAQQYQSEDENYDRRHSCFDDKLAAAPPYMKPPTTVNWRSGSAGFSRKKRPAAGFSRRQPRTRTGRPAKECLPRAPFRKTSDGCL